MNIEAHIACGWALGNLWRGSSRLERFLAAAAASFSDLDGLSYAFGEDAYANWHHTAGHTLCLAIPIAVAAMLLGRTGRRVPLLAVMLLGFTTHLAGDYFFSGWEVPLLWPSREWTVQFHPRIGLDHPINIVLSYASFAFMAVSMWLFGRTPFEFIWPKLDRLLARVAARKTADCRICSRRTGIICDECGEPMCLRDTVVRTGYRLVCKTCTESAAIKR